MFREQHDIYKRLNNLADAAITAASFVLAYNIRNNAAAIADFLHIGELAKFEYYSNVLLISCVLWPLLNNINGLYSPRKKAFQTDANIIFKSSLWATILLIAVCYLFQLVDISRVLVIGFAIINFVLLMGKDLVIRLYRAYLRTSGRNLRHVILIAGNDTMIEKIKLVAGHPEAGFRIIGIVTLHDVNEASKIAHPISILGHISKIKDILHNHPVDQVIFAVDRKSLADVEETMFVCEEEGVETWLATDFFELSLSRLEIEEINGLPFLVFRTAPALNWQLLIKYFLDFVFASVFLVVLAPLLLIIAFAIKLDSPGPVFYVQQRIGTRCRPFKLYKFRSMTNGSKITSVGKIIRKTGIDELPQLFNILKGEMSFVGPRPHIPPEVALYAHGWQRRRLSTRPGLTCYRQISHRGKVTFDTAMELDLKYIDNWSLAKDVVIIFKTVFMLLLRLGDSKPEYA